MAAGSLHPPPPRRRLGAASRGPRRAVAFVSREAVGVPILDLGVGAGRTTPILRALGEDYVGLDFAEEAARDRSYATAEEAVEARLASGLPPSPRAFVEEEAREHLVGSSDGRLRWRFSRAAAATIYGELCTEPPPPSALCAPALLVHAEQFGLVREEQLAEYVGELGDRLEVVAVPGGHIVYWDAYGETADAIEKFLLRPGVRRA